MPVHIHMKDDTIDVVLPGENPDDMARRCHMSVELFQNARQTMGELRDFMREAGISREMLQRQIERTMPCSSPVDKALDRMDEYATGIGRSLRDLPSNLH